MPYKRVNKTVYVKKDGKWIVLKVHKTIKKAIQHLAILNDSSRHSKN